MQVRELFQDRVFTISNLLTVIRIIAVPFIAYFMYMEAKTGDSDYQYYELAGLMVIIISDFFDGYLARLFNQVTRLGQFLDPVADKTSALTLAAFMVWLKGLPLWLYIIGCLREVIVFIASFFLYSKRDVEVKPNILGKLGAASMALCALSYTLSLSCTFAGITIKQLSVFLVLFFYLTGGILYLKTYSGYYFAKK